MYSLLDKLNGKWKKNKASRSLLRTVFLIRRQFRIASKIPTITTRKNISLGKLLNIVSLSFVSCAILKHTYFYKFSALQQIYMKLLLLLLLLLEAAANDEVDMGTSSNYTQSKNSLQRVFSSKDFFS